MAFKIRFRMDTLRVLGFAAIGAGYTAIGASFANPVRIIKLTNLTDKAVIISFNGATDQSILPAQSFTLYDLTTNKVRDDGFFIDVGTVVYAKQGPSGAPASGSVYLETVYAG